jgi:hypothetical protein
LTYHHDAAISGGETVALSTLLLSTSALILQLETLSLRDLAGHWGKAAGAISSLVFQQAGRRSLAFLDEASRNIQAPAVFLRSTSVADPDDQ